MVPLRPLTLLLLLPLFSSGCLSVTRNALAPVHALRYEPLRCVVTAGGNVVLPDSVDAGPADGVAGPIVTLTMNLYAVDIDLAAHLMGAQMNGLAAIVSSRADAEILRDQLAPSGTSRAEQISGPTALTLHSGQLGAVALINQTAYIRAFELTANADGAMVDPEVGVANDGLRILARVDHDTETRSNTVDLELWISRLDRPFQSIELPFGGHFTSLTLQVPSGVLRHLTTKSVLGPDESLIFGGAALPVFDSKRALLVVLDVKRDRSLDSSALTRD